ncbi:hypothetical protein SAY87_005423 [Trapa incisa]|uniref:Uncharacterized protein n=1 Tax=Trapa incisa TaxID=236973 RepID=A0AAN7K4R4_9MYRT|nr:hypothetical protein SAY87_005423 [Trapa incisa]
MVYDKAASAMYGPLARLNFSLNGKDGMDTSGTDGNSNNGYNSSKDSSCSFVASPAPPPVATKDAWTLDGPSPASQIGGISLHLGNLETSKKHSRTYASPLFEDAKSWPPNAIKSLKIEVCFGLP